MTKLLLLLFSGAKFTKIASSGGSMLLSLAAYATIWGWKFAAGFVTLLFCHEMGHYLAARERKLPVTLPFFIPFLGAAIKMKETPESVDTEAYVALAGPVAGSIAAFITYFAGRYYGSNLLLAVSYSGFLLNLCNLLPVSPLDGGRITAALSPRVWLVGAPIMAAAFYYMPSPVLLIIAIAAVPHLVKAWNYNPALPENRIYYAIPMAARFQYGASYLGLVALLGIMAYEVHGMLSHLRS